MADASADGVILFFRGDSPTFVRLVVNNNQNHETHEPAPKYTNETAPLFTKEGECHCLLAADGVGLYRPPPTSLDSPHPIR